VLAARIVGGPSRIEDDAGVASFDRDGVALWYAVSGTGRPVVLHTGGGGDSDMFISAGYAEALVDVGYRVVCFDHRGHGRSDKPLGREQHSTSEYVEDVVGLLDALELRSAAIIGYSQGMDIAIALAASHPERVAAIVGIGAVGAADEPTDWRIEAAAAVRENGMAAYIRDMAEHESEPPPEWLLDNLSSTRSEVFALLLEAALDDATDLWAHFPNVSAPVLLLVGEREEDEDGVEPGLAVQKAEQAANVIPDVVVQVLPQLTHLAAFWRSDLTVPAILEFLHEKYPP
jgi:pimeloyl-ACP methyl ester carboxylesterase